MRLPLSTFWKVYVLGTTNGILIFKMTADDGANQQQEQQQNLPTLLSDRRELIKNTQPTKPSSSLTSYRNAVGGRIRPHQQGSDDTVEILGGNITVSAEHIASVNATERQDINEKNRRNYRNRIKHIYEWLKTAYPEYYNVGVIELSEDQ
jgi:hypothetical protein